jgi:hypothetical protein
VKSSSASRMSTTLSTPVISKTNRIRSESPTRTSRPPSHCDSLNTRAIMLRPVGVEETDLREVDSHTGGPVPAQSLEGHGTKLVSRSGVQVADGRTTIQEPCLSMLNTSSSPRQCEDGLLFKTAQRTMLSRWATITQSGRRQWMPPGVQSASGVAADPVSAGQDKLSAPSCRRRTLSHFSSPLAKNQNGPPSH